MYYVAKIAQAAGLGVITLGFVMYFPRLINMRIFLTGIFLFIFGCLVQNFLLKK